MKISAVISPAASSMNDTKQQESWSATISQQETKSTSTYDMDDADREELEKAVNKLNKTAEIYNHKVKFSIHEETNRIMIQVIDKATNEVITESPPKQILDMVAQFQEMVGMLVDEKA